MLLAIARSKSFLAPFTAFGAVSFITSIRMSSMQETGRVVHDRDNREFYIQLGNKKAYLQYDMVDSEPSTVDLQHTVVPEAFRGQGVGKVLAKAAFDHFVSTNHQMKLTCWYLKKYYNENSTLYEGNVIA